MIMHKYSKIWTYIKTCLKYIQLHGDEDNNYIKHLKKEFDLKIIKSIGINNKDDLRKMDDLQLSDYFLFDYKVWYNILLYLFSDILEMFYEIIW